MYSNSIYILAPKYLYRDYLEAKVYFLGAFKAVGLFRCSKLKVGSFDELQIHFIVLIDNTMKSSDSTLTAGPRREHLKRQDPKTLH